MKVFMGVSMSMKTVLRVLPLIVGVAFVQPVQLVAPRTPMAAIERQVMEPVRVVAVATGKLLWHAWQGEKGEE
jgi:hypothetical protein